MGAVAAVDCAAMAAAAMSGLAGRGGADGDGGAGPAGEALPASLFGVCSYTSLESRALCPVGLAGNARVSLPQ